MPKQLRFLIPAFALLSVGLLPFILVRMLAPESSVSADSQQNNRASLEEHFRRLAEDAEKPIFFGSMNGMVFKERTTREDAGCPGPVEAITLDRVAADPFSVTPTYLPDGFQLVHQEASACGGKVSWHYEVYKGPLGELEIARSAGLAVASSAPADRMRSVTVNGIPSVLVLAVPGPGQPPDLPVEQHRTWRLYNPGKGSVVQLVSAGVPLEEGLRIVESIGGRHNEE